MLVKFSMKWMTFTQMAFQLLTPSASGCSRIFGGMTAEDFAFGELKEDFCLGYITVTRYESQVNVMQSCRLNRQLFQ